MRIADGAGGFDIVLDLGRQRLAAVRRMKIGVAVTPMAIMALLRLGPGRPRARWPGSGTARPAWRRRCATAPRRSSRRHSRPAAERHADAQRDADRDEAGAERGAGPQMTRLSMSRPTSSVPSQWAHDGGLRTAPQLVAMGSYGTISGAAMASRTNSTTMASPTMAPLRRLSRRQARAHGFSSVASATRRRAAGGVIRAASDSPARRPCRPAGSAPCRSWPSPARRPGPRRSRGCTRHRRSACRSPGW